MSLYRWQLLVAGKPYGKPQSSKAKARELWLAERAAGRIEPKAKASVEALALPGTADRKFAGAIAKARGLAPTARALSAADAAAFLSRIK